MSRKLKSVKLWVVVWAVVVISYIVWADRVSFVSVATLLSSIPLAYIGLNVAQKKIEGDRDVRMKDIEERRHEFDMKNGGGGK